MRACLGIVIAICVVAVNCPAQKPGHLGLPVDWSFRHIVSHAGAPAGSHDPRALYNAMRVARGQQSAFRPGPPPNLRHRGRQMHGDWHFSLGNGTMNSNNGASNSDASPAKFSFNVNTAPDCTNDYVVYALQVAGSSTQPNIVAFNNLYSGPMGSSQNIVKVSETGATATITTQAAHGFAVGQTVIIDGVPVNGYNGTFTISATTSTTFTYTTVSGLANLANGGGTATLATPIAASGASEIGNTVTIKTSTAHGLAAGDYVSIQGVTPSGYNGAYQVASIIDSTNFTYTSATTGLAAGGGGTAVKSGMCGLKPSIKFAYNASTNNDSMTASPVIALDGTQIAFIGSTGNSGGQGIFYVLTLPTSGSNGSWNATTNQYAAAVPGSSNNAGVLSYAYSTNAQNSFGSSPYVDYLNDVAYFGDDKGNIYKTTCVFYCAQHSLTLGTASGWPVNFGSKPMSSPVVDTTTGKLFVGSTDGYVYSCSVSNCSGTIASVAVGNGAANGGVVDGVLLDVTFQTLFTDSGQDSNNHFTIVQLDESLNNLATIANGTQAFPVPIGALSDEYYNMVLGATSATYGYFCGPNGGSGQAVIYTLTMAQPARAITGASEAGNVVTITTSSAHGFTVGDTVVVAGVAVAGYNGTFTITAVPSPNRFTYTAATTGLAASSGGTATQQQMTLTNPPTISTWSTLAIAGSNKATCSPYTILTNGTERLFFSQPSAPCPSGGAADGCLFSYSINSSGTLTQTGAASQHGGTSAIVVDNISNLPQAASIYFATEAKANPNTTSAPSCTYGTGGGAAYCAVKLTQSGLQ